MKSYITVISCQPETSATAALSSPRQNIPLTATASWQPAANIASPLPDHRYWLSAAERPTYSLLSTQAETTLFLYRAYLSTSYEAMCEGQLIQIKIHALTPALDSTLCQQKCNSWAYITAFNPYSSDSTTAAENRQQNQLLASSIQKLGHPFYHGAGRSMTSDWPPEESFLILGISEPQALKLGRRFRQNAIVYGELQAAAKLLLC